jgi:Protein of unknown function (DUF1194)
MLAKLVVLGTSTFLGLQAHAADVDVAIVFAVDVSASIDPATADLQREGHAEAICSPDVIAAIARNHIGCVGVTYFEWSSHGYLRMVLPWTRVCGLGDGKAVASVILERGRTGKGYGGTSISFALDEGSLLLDQFPGKAARKVIDIAANGKNNDGPSVQQSRAQAIANGYTINAIVISPLIRGMNLTEYFADNVIGGSGAFVISPVDASGYAAALRRKMVNETSLLTDLLGRSRIDQISPQTPEASLVDFVQR